MAQSSPCESAPPHSPLIVMDNNPSLYLKFVLGANEEKRHVRFQLQVYMWALFWFVFMLPNIYQLDSHNETCVLHSQPPTKHQQNWISSDLVVVIGSACLLIFLLEYTCPPNYAHNEV